MREQVIEKVESRLKIEITVTKLTSYVLNILL